MNREDWHLNADRSMRPFALLKPFVALVCFIFVCREAGHFIDNDTVSNSNIFRCEVVISFSRRSRITEYVTLQSDL